MREGEETHREKHREEGERERMNPKTLINEKKANVIFF